jgi:hypothetical protein
VIDFDKNKVTRILIEELHYNKVEATLFVDGIPRIHLDLHDALYGFLEQRIEQPFEFEGISIAQIMEISNCNYINALVTMNAFINDPTLIKEYESIHQ